jgi:hypothetical protein
MTRFAPAPLRENLGLAFVGERVDPARVVSAAEARRLHAARNPTGRPNADVLREFVGVTAAGDEVRRWAIDFPAALHPSEAPLYEAPLAALGRAGLPPVSRERDDVLRNALARLERFLARPLRERDAAFAWMEAEFTPDDSLLVWARDDDFSAGVLNSRLFSLWSAGQPPLDALRSFPFPWPPQRPLSTLSREQEDRRFALARAARSEDAAATDDAATRAYGWPPELSDDELLARLRALHAERSAP